MIKQKAIMEHEEIMEDAKELGSKEELKQKLIAAKSHIEHELKRLDKHDVHVNLISVVEKTREIIDSATRMQDELNRVWKRLEQVYEELNILKQQTE